ncbi:SMODS domain-containing nucleotidyltransferase [Deinococcus yunweiensis]|uniref:SMODS domain-containing nucleotidyltransferase n=1 Tax=Deinococcus yunweiensis TaxID=367282 RepID=UPI00398E7A5E
MIGTTYQTLNKEFDEFDRLIRPKADILKAAQRAHLDVRRRIGNDSEISRVHVADFLQGSYARHTMVEPPLDEHGDPEKADVDIILVTSISEETTPQQVLELTRQWLEREYGEGTAEIQSRSVKLSLPDVEVDLVPTSAPSEAVKASLKRYADETARMETRSADPGDDVLDPDEVFGPSRASADDQWTQEPLRIPDVYAHCWEDTHPLATLEFTVDKNRRCDRRFLRVARALKWWRRQTFKTDGNKHPKSYPVEHMAGDHCPDDFSSIAEGLTLTLEGLRDAYADYYPHSKPELPPRGLNQSKADVISRLTQEDFNAFYEGLRDAATLARNALEAATPEDAGACWHTMLGEKFPKPVSTSRPAARAAGGFVGAAASQTPVGGRFG